MIFLDTSGIYALADRTDQYHEQALSMLDAAKQRGEPIVTHSYILVESAALLQRRLGLAVALQFLHDAKAFDVRWVSPELHEKSVTELRCRHLQSLSLVDVVSFLLMKDLGIATYFGFDGHFAEEGFTQVPI